jgi:hypothetical protein
MRKGGRIGKGQKTAMLPLGELEALYASVPPDERDELVQCLLAVNPMPRYAAG